MSQKLFRVKAEKSTSAESLVLAEDREDANKFFLKALTKGRVEFDGFGERGKIVSCYPANLSNRKEVEREIKAYGVVCSDGGIVYEGVLKEIEKQMNKQEKEEWLKKNHLEFNFGK